MNVKRYNFKLSSYASPPVVVLFLGSSMDEAAEKAADVAVVDVDLAEEEEEEEEAAEEEEEEKKAAEEAIGAPFWKKFLLDGNWTPQKIKAETFNLVEQDYEDPTLATPLPEKFTHLCLAFLDNTTYEVQIQKNFELNNSELLRKFNKYFGSIDLTYWNGRRTDEGVVATLETVAVSRLRRPPSQRDLDCIQILRILLSFLINRWQPGFPVQCVTELPQDTVVTQKQDGAVFVVGGQHTLLATFLFAETFYVTPMSGSPTIYDEDVPGSYWVYCSRVKPFTTFADMVTYTMRSNDVQNVVMGNTMKSRVHALARVFKNGFKADAFQLAEADKPMGQRAFGTYKMRVSNKAKELSLNTRSIRFLLLGFFVWNNPV